MAMIWHTPAIQALTNVTEVTILYAGASNHDNEMTPGRCSFLRALHDYFRSLSGPVPHKTQL
jgi:hypothetical protein